MPKWRATPSGSITLIALKVPLRRVGAKGSGSFVPITWDEAMDEVTNRFGEAEAKLGSETVWPYFYAGTMGLVMCNGINRLRHVKRYSGQHSTICTTLAWSGYMAGTGALMGPDPREMAKADCVVIWGTNPVNTQVNVMTHAVRARKERGAKIVVVDTYRTGTAEQADLFLCVKPGTDAALACGVMHVLFRDAMADHEWMRRYTDDAEGLEKHLEARTPQWAEAICGVSVAEIEAFARLVGTTPKTYLRLGYGFCRGRNGAVSMHAASCIASVTGSWRHEGGGAFHNNGQIYRWDRTMIEGLDKRDASIRVLDQSRIGRVLTGDGRDLGDGPPVTAMLIQNTNPMVVAPDLGMVHKGFARDDLFCCVHEQFMTETAKMADIVLPATMFLEHDDIYQGGGHQHIMWGPKLVEAPGECWTQSRGHLRSRPPPRRGGRASRLLDDAVGTGGSRDARLGVGAAGRPRCQQVDGRPARLRTCPLHQGVRPSRRQVPFLRGLVAPAQRLRSQRHAWDHAGISRFLGRHRHPPPLPPCDGACAQLPQFELHRDADINPEGIEAHRPGAPR